VGYSVPVIQVVDGTSYRPVLLGVLLTAVPTVHGGNTMTNKSIVPVRWLVALAVVLPMTGCLAAAAAGAGAGIYLTSRGAESLVEGSIDQIATRARAVMNEEGIVPDASSTENGGENREFKGKKGDLDVTIQMEQKSDKTTRVEVTARKNLAEWDKDYAQQVLQRIVEKG
jgi:hypothetical protein